MNNRRKPSLSFSNKGISSILLLIILVVFAILLTNIGSNFVTKNPQTGILDNSNPANTSYDSLSMRNMHLITTTPTPMQGNLTGVHGAFNIYTREEVVKAHNAGVTYDIIDYWGNYGPAALAWDVNPATDLGKALQSYNMKGYLMLSDLLSRSPDGSGSIVLDSTTLIQRVKQYVNSPLLGGYWIKDDDPQLCGDGNYSAPMITQLQTEYKLIRQIDTNKSHIIMAGFCDSADLNKNYHPTATAPIADAVGMYPYPNIYRGWSFFTDVPTEVKAEVNSVKTNTPAGVTLPTMVGIYAGFWGDNCYLGIYHCNGGVAPISPTELTTDIDAFMNNGFAGVVDFAFEAADVNHTGGNDSTMLQYVQNVTTHLKSIGKY